MLKHSTYWTFSYQLMHGFPNSSKGWGESEILWGGGGLLGEGNLRRSDFDN